MKKSIYDQIEEEFSRLINEDAVLMGDVSNASSEMVSTPADAIDNTIKNAKAKVPDNSIKFKDTLGTYTPGDGVMSAKNNYTGNGLSAMAIQTRLKESTEMNNKQYFLKSDIQGLEECSGEDLFNQIISFIMSKVPEQICPKCMAICGSRNRNTASDDSDLDVAMEYDGEIPEDDVYGMLNAEPGSINNIPLDIRPIRKSETGCMKDYLTRSMKYDDYVIERMSLVEKKKKRKKQHYRRFYGYYPYWPIPPAPPPPPPEPGPTPPPPGPPPPGPGPEPGPAPAPSGGDVGGGMVGESNADDKYMDPSQYVKCKKTSYTVQVYVPEKGTKVHNKFENSNYVTNEKKPYVLVGTAGEEWTVDASKIMKTYTYNGKKITEDILKKLSDGKKHDLETIVGDSSAYLWCIKVPKNEKIKVQTSWGETLEANRSGVPHADGDYIIADNKNDAPNMDDRWVVNGEIFKNTYELI